MKTQMLQTTGEKSTGLTVDQIAAFIEDCRGMESRGYKVLEMQGRTTMGGRLWRIATTFAEQPSTFASTDSPRS